MSLLDRNAPHIVWVQRRESTRDASGVAIMVPVGLPIPVHCMVQIARDWSSAEESLNAGMQVYDMRVIYAREWPGDESSHIIYDGRLWEMVGGAQHTHVSRRTAHWRCTVRVIGHADDPEPPIDNA